VSGSASAAWITVGVALAGACAGRTRLGPAGGETDEGNGDLATASIKLLTRSSDAEDLFAESAPRPPPEDEAGADEDVEVTAEEDSGWAQPDIEYIERAGLSGAVEGVVRWTGARPARFASPCGPVDMVRVGADGGVGGVLVWIDDVTVVREPQESHVESIGGVVVKRGCAFLPTAQVMWPAPGSLQIHGDSKAVRTKVSWTPARAPVMRELEAGGLVSLESGDVARIEAESGGIAPAWVVGLATPYFAITDDQGRFRIDELAAGTYRVTLWRAPLPTSAGKALGPPLVVQRTVRVGDARTTRLDVALPR
jgi:hypothetical protein